MSLCAKGIPWRRLRVRPLRRSLSRCRACARASSEWISMKQLREACQIFARSRHSSVSSSDVVFPEASAAAASLRVEFDVLHRHSSSPARGRMRRVHHRDSNFSSRSRMPDNSALTSPWRSAAHALSTRSSRRNRSNGANNSSSDIVRSINRLTLLTKLNDRGQATRVVRRVAAEFAAMTMLLQGADLHLV